MGGINNKAQDTMPKSYSYQKSQNLIQELNCFCKQNSRQLGFQLYVKGTDLQYNNADWKKSLVPGLVTIRKKPWVNTYHVIMNMKNIYDAHETMKHFEKRLSESRTTPNDSTPGYIKQSQQCCICLDKTPTMMLPCFHSFCVKCTQIHIIEKQEKKCPVCRTQYHQDNDTLNKRIITIVGDEQSLMSDLKIMLLGYLRELNSHQVKLMEEELKSNASAYGGDNQVYEQSMNEKQ